MEGHLPGGCSRAPCAVRLCPRGALGSRSEDRPGAHPPAIPVPERSRLRRLRDPGPGHRLHGQRAVEPLRPADRQHLPRARGLRRRTSRIPTAACRAGRATRHDPEHAAGVNITGAWAQGNLGRADVRDRLHRGRRQLLQRRDQGRSRQHLPEPGRAAVSRGSRTARAQGTYDLDHNGRFDIRDYAHDPRVNPPCPAGTEPVHAPRGGHDAGLRGERPARVPEPGRHRRDPDAISVPRGPDRGLRPLPGHRRQAGRLPARAAASTTTATAIPTTSAAGTSSATPTTRRPTTPPTTTRPGLISRPRGRGQQRLRRRGRVPQLPVLPIKQGAEAVGRTDQLGAGDPLRDRRRARRDQLGRRLLHLLDFAREAIDYAYRHGVLLSLDSNDFDSMDHTDGMLLRPRPPRATPLTQDAGRAPTTHDLPRPQQRHQLRHPQHLLGRGQQHLGRDAVPGRRCWRWCSPRR